jgi:hypothetical protein
MANRDSSSHNWVQVAQTPSDDGVTKRVVVPSWPGNLFFLVEQMKANLQRENDGVVASHFA